MHATKHAPREQLRLLERRHGLVEIVECGAIVLVERPWTVELRGARATQMQRLDAEFLLPLLDKYPLVRWEITGIAEKRLRESTLLQVVPKEQTRLPSSACLSQSFSYHADLLEDDGDGLRTPPGARGGAGQLI